MYKLELNLRPPSVNTYWRKWKNRMVISDKGREFKKKASILLSNDFLEDGPYILPVKMCLELYFKDNRRRDIDNYCKGILDSMSGIVFEDDSQIQELNLKKFCGYGEDKIIIKVEVLG